MASQIQKVMYEGYLGADPEMRFTPKGQPVTNFRIGSTRQYNPDGKTVKEVTWLRVTAWNSLAEIINKYCAKGSHVIVTGRLRPGENGSPTPYPLSTGGFGASYEITAEEVRIIKGKERVAGEGESEVEEPLEDDPFK